MTDFANSFKKIVHNSALRKQAVKKVNQKVIDGVLSLILQNENNQDLQILESFFDDYLWPLFSDDSTDSHVLIIAAGLQSKLNGEKELDVDDNDKLRHFLVRLIQIFDKEDTSYYIKSLAVRAIHVLFLNLNNTAIRKQTAPLVSILTWSKLSNLETLLKDHDLEKQYSTHLKRLEQLTRKEMVEQLLLSQWVSHLLMDVVSNTGSEKPGFNDYAVDVFVLLTSFLGQLPTRRFLRTLVLRSQVVPVSKSINSGSPNSFSALALLEFYLKFPINEFTGEIIDAESVGRINSGTITELQVTAFKSFKEQLGYLALATHDTFNDHDMIFNMLDRLTDGDLDALLNEFSIKFLVPVEKKIKIETCIFHLISFMDYSTYLKASSGLPTEQSLNEIFTLSPYTLPNLKGQFLSISDFMIRNYLLYKADCFVTIAEHLKRTVQRFEFKKDKANNKLIGNSKHAVKISSPKFSTSSPTFIESNFSVIVEGSIKVDLNNSSETAIEEWNALEKGDVVLLLSVEARNNKSTDEFEKIGVSTLRSGVIQDKLNNNGEVLNKVSKNFSLKIHLDSQTFLDKKESVSYYENFNLIIKLPATLSKYYIRLTEILKSISTSDEKLPDWLYGSFLGFGDPNAGSFDNVEQSIDPVTFSGRGHTVKDIQASFSKLEVVLEKQDQKRRKTSSNSSSSTSDTASPFSLSIKGKKLTLKGIDNSSGYPSKLNTAQLQATILSQFNGLIVVDGASGTGEKSLIYEFIKGWTYKSKREKILLVSKSQAHLTDLFQVLSGADIDNQLLFNVGDKDSQIIQANNAVKRLHDLLGKVDELANVIGVEGAYSNDIGTAVSFFKFHVHEKWVQYLKKVKERKSIETVSNGYPFAKFGILEESDEDPVEIKLSKIAEHYSLICGLFDDLQELLPFEFLESTEDRIENVFAAQSQVIGVTIDDLFTVFEQMNKLGITFENIIISEASLLTQFESLFPIIFQESSTVKKIALFGDSKTVTPTSYTPLLSSVTHLTTSLFKRFKDLGTDVISLNIQYNKRPQITTLLQNTYPELINESGEEFQVANAGLLNPIQFLRVDGEETQPISGVFQNVQEAEYAIQLYQYLRLLSYPSKSISILTLEEGQCALLKEIAATKCGDNDASDELADFRFGVPQISTVECFRGAEAEIVIFSSVRSKVPDDRTVSTALSSSKFGFYALGSQVLLDELKEAGGDSILKRIVESTENHKLHVVVGEMYSRVKRTVSDKGTSFQMENLEHFSQFVYEMTQKRLAAANK